MALTAISLSYTYHPQLEVPLRGHPLQLSVHADGSSVSSSQDPFSLPSKAFEKEPEELAAKLRAGHWARHAADAVNGDMSYCCEVYRLDKTLSSHSFRAGPPLRAVRSAQRVRRLARRGARVRGARSHGEEAHAARQAHAGECSDSI